MLPYWILFSGFALAAINAPPRSGQRPSPVFILALLLVSLMIGLRYRVGGDWSNYREMFQVYRYMDFSTAIVFGDPGYALLNIIAHGLGTGIWLVNLVCGAIFMWGLLRFSQAQPNPWLACLIAVPYLIIVVAMAYTRQAVAIGFILLALVAFMQHRYAKFFILVLLAASFHKTAIVIVPLLVPAITKNRLVLGALFLATVPFLYSFFLGASMDKLVTNYVEANYNSEGAAVRVAMNVLPAALFFIAGRRMGFPEIEWKIWRNMSLASFACLAALFLISSSTAVDRLALYLIPLQIVVWSRLPYALTTDLRISRFLVYGLLVYSAAIQFVWLNYAVHARLWIPYRVYPFGADPSALR